MGKAALNPILQDALGTSEEQTGYTLAKAVNEAQEKHDIVTSLLSLT